AKSTILWLNYAVGAQTEMKRVVGDNATLPCHHQFWQSNSQSLDIEWLLQKPNSKQRVIITFFGGQVYTNEVTGSEASRLSFAGEYLNGDASLLISDLLLTDSGEYYCKVKTGGKYHWSQVNLIVLVKPSKPRCWMDGKLLEGSDVKLSCKSSDGSDPISYKWERVLDKGKSLGKLPNLALIDLKNPEIVTLRNLTMDSTGVYKCTASNDVGEENCIIEVTMQHVRDVGMVAGAVVGISLGVLIVILIIWLVFRKKEKKKYEEEETPNEIRFVNFIFILNVDSLTLSPFCTLRHRITAVCLFPTVKPVAESKPGLCGPLMTLVKATAFSVTEPRRCVGAYLLL
uniref:Ig-like domain-containing protein n=1 Tax=Myripristis murdjan TaxID=586833 RepID=A0A667X474_9TELE